jgi:DNA polymerase-3 subunit beta
MKARLLQENLTRGVGIVSRVVAGKAQLPVLANILLKTEQGKIRLSATNLETGINLWLGAKVEKSGKITVPAKVLGELVSSLPQDTAELLVEEDKLRISCGTVRAVLNGISAEEFPAMPSLKGQEKQIAFRLKTEELAQAVKQVAFAAGMDEGRPIFTGVKLEIKGKEMRLAATDGYRLSVMKITGVTGFKGEKELVVPARALLEMVKMIGQEGEKNENEKENQVVVAITDEEKQMILAVEGAEVVTRLIEGEFPDFDKIIPTSSKTKIVLEREELLNAVRSASIFARDSANIVKFKLTGDKLIISANAPQVGENEVSLEGKKTGEDGEIAFNCRYLLEMLGAVEADKIEMEISGALSPGLFRLVGQEEFLHIVMPVRVQA